ncbi:MAG: hypothetical protein ACLTSX_01215 [Collinsella sp.]
MDIQEIGRRDQAPEPRREARMTDEGSRGYIHKLELKAAVLEGTVKVLKAEASTI